MVITCLAYPQGCCASRGNKDRRNFYELSKQELGFRSQPHCLIAGLGWRSDSVSLSFRLLSCAVQSLPHRTVGGSVAQPQV